MREPPPQLSKIAQGTKDAHQRRKVFQESGETVCTRTVCENQVTEGSMYCSLYCNKKYLKDERRFIGLSELEVQWIKKEDNLILCHSITTEDYCRILYDVQGGACPVCPETTYAPAIRNMLNGSEKFWVVDHDHSCCAPRTTSGGNGMVRTCGQCIRGIICVPCNIALVSRWQDEDWRMSALNYLGLSSVLQL